jgi:hypothetical protein
VLDDGVAAAAVAVAVAVAALHGALVLFMVTGGLLGLRRRRLLLLHGPLTIAILAVNVLGADCPVTAFELRLRALAGEPPYRDGFIGHYLVEPLGLHLHSPAVQAGLYAIALVPNLVAYGLLLARAARHRAFSHTSTRT